MRGHALQKQGRRNLGGDVVRNRHQALDRRHDVGGVRTRHGCPGHAGARPQIGHRAADLFDGPGALEADGKRQRQGIEPSAVVDVDEVEPRGLHAHQGFARSRSRRGHLRQHKNLGTTGLLGSYRLHEISYSHLIQHRRRACPSSRASGNDGLACHHFVAFARAA